jgi:hypothetical protein
MMLISFLRKRTRSAAAASAFTALLFLSAGDVSLARPVEMIPQELRGARQPQVAVAPGGAVHVTFGKDTGIYHVSSADEGRTFSTPVKVGELPKLALGMRRGPRISATTGTVVITAISHAEGALRAWYSKDAGRTWTEPVQINDVPNSAREGLHAMAADGSGFVVAVWLDLRNAGMELWSSTSSDGGATWSANRRVYHSPEGNICECCHPSVAISATGEIAVMWRNFLGGARDMYLATSRDGGSTFGAAQKLGTGTWQLNGCPMDGGAIAYDHAGELRSVWRREKVIFTASPGAPEQRLAEASQPIVIPTAADAIYLWQSGTGLMLKVGSAAAASLAANAAFPAAAALDDGRVIAVWEASAGESSTMVVELLP